jgi:hypothetical protein
MAAYSAGAAAMGIICMDDSSASGAMHRFQEDYRIVSEKLENKPAEGL